MKIQKTQRSDLHLLPEEIIEEILSTLDVKSLLRYRCVSKSYRSLIDSKRFIKIHHQKSTRNTTLAHHRVLFFSDIYSCEAKVWECSLLSFFDSSKYKPLNFPTNIVPPRYDAISFVGCCNGLVCILLRINMNSKSSAQFILWNPCTGISKKLPHHNKIVGWYDLKCYGFGWDESSDDYKVITIVSTVEGQTICKIYNLKSDSWKKIKGWDDVSSGWYVPFRVGLLARGKLHWERRDRTKSHHEWELVAFDLKREVFQMVEQPFYFDDFIPLLGTFGECFALQCSYDDYKEIWVMKEESWEKVMVIDDCDRYGSWTSPSVAASYNGGKGEIILMNIHYDTNYLAYDLKNKCIYCLGLPTDYSEIYIESLVSPLE